MLRILVPPAVILLAATTLGLSFNALRSRDGIELGRTYFSDRTEPVPPPPANGHAGTPGAIDAPPGTPQAAGPEPEPVPSPGALALRARASAEFTIVDARQVRQFIDAAQVDASGVVIIDARDDKHFLDGHIPRALQLDYFNVRQDIEPVRPYLQLCTLQMMPVDMSAPIPEPHPPTDEFIGVPRNVLPLVLVYCESDECEDGFNLCRLLRDDYAIDPKRILLYLGGFRDWQWRKMTIARGGEVW